MEDKRKRMEELVARLNRAGRAYYQESRELISNQEYDELYDELQGAASVAYAFSGQNERSRSIGKLAGR